MGGLDIVKVASLNSLTTSLSMVNVSPSKCGGIGYELIHPGPN